MKRWTQKAVILAVGVVIMLTAGCEKEKPLANENMQLKEQLEQCEKEVEKQKALEEQSKERVAGMMDTISKTVGEENIKLGEENAKLKTQIEQLEVHVQQLEKELKKIAAPQPLVPQPL